MRAPAMALFAALTLSAMACTPPPKPDAGAVNAETAEESKPESNSEASPAEPEATPDAVDASAERPLGTAHKGDPDFIEAEPGPPLTKEEEELIAADPETLSKEQRRARAYAQRKKIMLNPDSPQAQAILRGAKQLREGTMQIPNSSEPPPGSEITLQAPKVPEKSK